MAFELITMEIVPENILVSFSDNENGQKIMSITINGGSPIKSVEYKPVEYSKEQLQKYAGNYYSEELNSYYELRSVNDSLLLYINGEQKSQVKSIKENLLSNDDYGILDFSENEKEYIGFKLMAGRVKNLRFDRKLTSTNNME